MNAVSKSWLTRDYSGSRRITRHESYREKSVVRAHVRSRIWYQRRTAPFGHGGLTCLPSWKNTTPPAASEVLLPSGSSLTPNIYLIRPKNTLARARTQEKLKAGLTLESFDGRQHNWPGTLSWHPHERTRNPLLLFRRSPPVVPFLSSSFTEWIRTPFLNQRVKRLGRRSS